MSQLLGGATGVTPPPVPDTSVGYTPQGPPGTPTAASSGGAPLGPGPGPPGDIPPIHKNLGLVQKFTNLLGATPEEREKNARAFAALTKDIGSIGRTMGESSLMQRMMKEQMGSASIIPGASPAGGIAAIPRTFDPGQASNIMSQLGFK